MAYRLTQLAEQVIVIPGATNGIGLCTARMAAERSASVVLAAPSDAVLDEVVQELSRNGAKALACAVDVADRQQVEEVAARAIAEFGRIDTWVNDAGVSIYARIDEVSEEDARRLFDTNFWGVFNGSLAALPHLRDGAVRSSTSAARSRMRSFRRRASTRPPSTP